MSRKIIALTLLSFCVVGSGTSFALTMSGRLVMAHENHDDKMTSSMTEVCPVSGEPIEKGSNYTYGYKEKTYRLCCPSCVEEFKKDPEKYINKMVKQNTGKS